MKIKEGFKKYSTHIGFFIFITLMLLVQAKMYTDSFLEWDKCIENMMNNGYGKSPLCDSIELNLQRLTYSTIIILVFYLILAQINYNLIV